jgi:DNA-binding NtrC family response regulator
MKPTEQKVISKTRLTIKKRRKIPRELLMRTAKTASPQLWTLATMGNSRSAQQARVEVRRLSKRSDAVLIVGPEGSGRESLARCIHAASSRSGRPFVTLNCRSISEGAVFESQVFGHLPGAFAGLKTSSLGLLQAAHGGTLFLRDVESLKLEAQWKLFHALQAGKIIPRGGCEAIPVDVRAIASTDVELSSGVEAGSFLGDFFEMLSANLAEVSPLADRMDDLPELADEIVREVSARRNLLARRFSPSATDWIGRYEWPGNLRELRQAIETVITSGNDEIDARELRLALKKVNACSTAAVVRRIVPVRFTGFAAMRMVSATRCRA